MDHDIELIREGTMALIALQVRFKEAPILEKLKLKPVLDEAINEFAMLQRKLLDNGTITSDADLAEIAALRTAIDEAANHQHLLEAGTKFLGFVAKFA